MFSRLPQPDPGMVDRIKDELPVELNEVRKAALAAEATLADLNKKKLRLERAIASLKPV
jgi:hypothetical protein